MPTEAQWEKAATWNEAERQKYHFPWGNKFSGKRCNLMASLSDNSSNPLLDHGLIVHGAFYNLQMAITSGQINTSPVGKYSPMGDSFYGCCDMIGNVDEWCNSVMMNYPYQSDDGREEETVPGRKCIRGGDWFTLIAQSGIRRGTPSENWFPLWGFRVAVSSEIRKAKMTFRQNIDAQIIDGRKEFELNISKKPECADDYFDWGSRFSQLLVYGIDKYLEEMEHSFSKAIKIFEGSKSWFFSLSKNSSSTPPYHLYFNRALVRGKLKNYNGAVKDLTQAIKLEKTDADLYINRAWFACYLKNYAQARKDTKKANTLNPEACLDKKIIEIMLLEDKKDWRTVISLYADIINSDVFSIFMLNDIYLWRANAYKQIGDTAKELSDYYHHFLIHPKDINISDIIKNK